MMRKKLSFWEYSFVALVFVLSICNIVYWNFFHKNSSLNIASQIVSIVGILGVVLYLNNVKRGENLIYLWGFVQLLVVTHYVNGVEEPWLNLSQFLRLPFRLAKDEDFEIKINSIAIFYTAMSYKLYLTSLRGSVTYISAYRENSYLNDILPAFAEILEYVKVRDEDGWVLVKIGGLGDSEEGYAVIKPKDKEERFKPGQKKQILYFIPVKDISVITRKDIPEYALGRGDWAYSSDVKRTR